MIPVIDAAYEAFRDMARSCGESWPDTLNECRPAFQLALRAAIDAANSDPVH